MESFFSGGSCGLCNLVGGLSLEVILFGADIFFEEPFLPLEIEFCQLAVGQGFYELGPCAADFFAFDGDQGLSGFDPLADGGVQFHDTGGEAETDNGFAVVGCQHVPHGFQGGFDGFRFNHGCFNIDLLLHLFGQMEYLVAVIIGMALLPLFVSCIFFIVLFIIVCSAACGKGCQ